MLSSYSPSSLSSRLSCIQHRHWKHLSPEMLSLLARFQAELLQSLGQWPESWSRRKGAGVGLAFPVRLGECFLEMALDVLIIAESGIERSRDLIFTVSASDGGVSCWMRSCSCRCCHCVFISIFVWMRFSIGRCETLQCRSKSIGDAFQPHCSLDLCAV